MFKVQFDLIMIQFVYIIYQLDKKMKWSAPNLDFSHGHLGDIRGGNGAGPLPEAWGEGRKGSRLKGRKSWVLPWSQRFPSLRAGYFGSKFNTSWKLMVMERGRNHTLSKIKTLTPQKWVVIYYIYYIYMYIYVCVIICICTYPHMYNYYVSFI